MGWLEVPVATRYVVLVGSRDDFGSERELRLCYDLGLEGISVYKVVLRSDDGIQGMDQEEVAHRIILYEATSDGNLTEDSLVETWTEHVPDIEVESGEVVSGRIE